MRESIKILSPLKTKVAQLMYQKSLSTLQIMLKNSITSKLERVVISLMMLQMMLKLLKTQRVKSMLEIQRLTKNTTKKMLKEMQKRRKQEK